MIDGYGSIMALAVGIRAKVEMEAEEVRMNFSELPEPSYWRSPRPVGGGVLYRSRLDAVRNCEQLCEPVFTEAQLLAYGSAIKEWAAKELAVQRENLMVSQWMKGCADERERCAKAAEGLDCAHRCGVGLEVAAAIREGKQ